MEPEKLDSKIKVSAADAAPGPAPAPAPPAVSEPAANDQAVEDKKASESGPATRLHNNNKIGFSFSLNHLIYLVLFAFFCLSVCDLIDQRHSLAWDKTTAVINISAIDQHNYSARAKGTVPVKVVYSYSVAGKQYSSTRINFCRAFSVYENVSTPAYKQLMAVCKPNAKVQIFYDPESPNNAVLDRSPDPGDWMILLACPVLAMLMFVLSAFGADRVWWLDQGAHMDKGAFFRSRK